MTLTTRKINRPGSKESLYVIEDNGVPVGFITKFANTRTDSNPFKLFLYNGPFVAGETESTMVEVSYEPWTKARKILLDRAVQELAVAVAA
jgi:hypothetical protein